MSKPVAHYSASYRAGDLLFVSGQLGMVDGVLLDGVEAQTRQALVNMASVLGREGLNLGDVAKCTIFLADIEDFGLVNETYAQVFGDHRPARSAFAVGALPLGARVEIEAYAHFPAAK